VLSPSFGFLFSVDVLFFFFWHCFAFFLRFIFIVLSHGMPRRRL